MSRQPRHEFAVRYRRASWEYRQVRFFQAEQHALRFVRKITTPTTRGYAPLVELTIERREVGPWTTQARIEVKP